MTRSTLMARFKKFTGTTIMKYHAKIKSACHLITMESNIKLKELSDFFEFYDEFHFLGTFKSHLEMTVSQYKDQISAGVTSG